MDRCTFNAKFFLEYDKKSSTYWKMIWVLRIKYNIHFYLKMYNNSIQPLNSLSIHPVSFSEMISHTNHTFPIHLSIDPTSIVNSSIGIS